MFVLFQVRVYYFIESQFRITDKDVASLVALSGYSRSSNSNVHGDITSGQNKLINIKELNDDYNVS